MSRRCHRCNSCCCNNNCLRCNNNCGFNNCCCNRGCNRGGCGFNNCGFGGNRGCFNNPLIWLLFLSGGFFF
ncbi:hypothetical protein ACFO6R_05650 [Eubacterium multiforme]|uniref:Ground-like protein n=1 Tax=Eubacterium multiforme TaxID=83339 RepID=A0ABT9UR09_9FIRM|nr:hypothetical protein [Eubacterium multiforme]MDQ0149066.1 hypothetical protein [Eubacterium multiforme]